MSTERKHAFSCRVVDLGKRYLCTSDDGTKQWLAGPDYIFEGKRADGVEAEPEPMPPTGPRVPKSVEATKEGVDGNKIFEITKISGGVKPEAAIDGKKSTFSEGKELIAELDGVGHIRTFALKFEEGPYNFEILVSLNGTDYLKIPLGSLTSDIKTPAETFQYFILPDLISASYVKLQSEQDMKIVTFQLLEVDPDPAGEPVPDLPPQEIPPPEVPQQEGIPIPTGYVLKGPVMLQKFKHWGRHSTNYASGGSGPSERWNLPELPDALNCLVGYEVNLGEAKGEKGEDNFDCKFRGGSHDDSNGGWYIPSFSWGTESGNAAAHSGKEYPHPKTNMAKIQEATGAKLGIMKGNFWVGYLAAVYNDSKGVPIMKLWGKPKGKDNSNKFSDYVYMGMSQDTGNMQPGPILNKIGMKGSKSQILQIRMDEVPEAKIRNAFAVEIETPKN